MSDPAPGHNIDGWMPEIAPLHDGNRRRFGWDDLHIGYDEFEPDGELFARGVSVQIEQMDDNLWWMAIRTTDGREVHVNLWSKKPITMRWSDESLQRMVDTIVANGDSPTLDRA